MIQYNTLDKLSNAYMASKLYEASEIASGVESITEATFYGKNEKLKKIETLLIDMCAKTHKDVKYVSSKEFADRLVNIGDMLAGIFGFSSVSINESVICFIPPIMYAVSSGAGYTLCHSQIHKYSKVMTGKLETWAIDMDKNHKGVQFAPGVKYDMRMFLSVDLFAEHGENSMTGGEILAIMLHEIGHNFYVGPIRELTPELMLFFTTGDLSIMVSRMVSRLILMEGSAAVDSTLSDSTRKSLTQLYNQIGVIISTISSIDTVLSVIISFLKYTTVLAKLLSRALNPLNIAAALAGYDPEKYSDAFATSYGYGPELSMALTKLGAFHIAFSTSQKLDTITNFFVTLYRIPADVLTVMIDPHPDTPGRLLNDIKYMEEAGKSITNPRQKAEWQQNLNELYEIRDQAMAYNGIDLGKNKTKASLIIKEFTHLTDVKDLSSTLNAAHAKYKNIDM